MIATTTSHLLVVFHAWSKMKGTGKLVMSMRLPSPYVCAAVIG